jgi:hypothetical protein
MSKIHLDTSTHHSGMQYVCDKALPSGRRGRCGRVWKRKIPDSFDRSDVLNKNMIENARVPQIPGFDTICNTRVVLASVLQRIKITSGELNYTLFSGIMKSKNKN